MDYVRPDGDVNRCGYFKPESGGIYAHIPMRRFDLLQFPPQSHSHAFAAIPASFYGLVHEPSRFLPHAEFPRREIGSHVLRGFAYDGYLKIVDAGRAVHGDAGQNVHRSLCGAPRESTQWGRGRVGAPV